MSSQSLQHAFSENKPISTLASALIQHWALILGAYKYNIYKTGKENSNADVLSCLLLPESSAGNVPLPGETISLIDSYSPRDTSELNAVQI